MNAPPAPTRRALAHAVLAALVLVAANAAKPLVVDDAAYVAYARQILAHPADPYGFEIHWYGAPEPAFGVLAPPVLPYWLAGAMALLGDEPLRWKLALLPFAAALAFALERLLARFAPGLETRLLWLALLSPTLLPAFNLMLDVPALALALAALATFLAACDSRRLAAAALAGALAGVAMQTKYNAASVLAAMLAWGVLAQRMREALAAAACAVAVFAGWEGLMALRYGESHFVHALGAQPAQLAGGAARAALAWTQGLLALAGALAPAVGLVGLAALGARAPSVAAAALVAAAVFAALPWLPAPALERADAWPEAGTPPPEGVAFVALGIATAACSIAAAWRGLRRGGLAGRFLAAWLAIEIAGSVALSPFLAARRLIGVALVALLACGHALAACSAGGAAARAALRLPLLLGAALGALHAASDLADALAERAAVAAADARLRELGADPARETRWFVGHWGFQFYAERAGMRAVVPGRSALREGDWLLVPEGVSAQRILAPTRAIQALDPPVSVASALAWSSLPWSYTGALPIRPRPAARLRVALFRAVEDFVPRPAPPPPGRTRAGRRGARRERASAAPRLRARAQRATRSR